MASLSLSELLKSKNFPDLKESAKTEAYLKSLQLKMLRCQQGLWQHRGRVIILLEGFDAAGKGGVIKRVTEQLDPRGVRVIPIGPPDPHDQSRHYLYRFWKDLPLPGNIVIFDRSWYGRVLVERVEDLIPKARWKDAFDEINEFEATLARDGIKIIKIFLAIDKEEQLKRFQNRLNDPYRNWKLTLDDIKARQNWDLYVEAVDEIFLKTDKKAASWHLIAANDKTHARQEALEMITDELKEFGKWTEDQTNKHEQKQVTLAMALKELGIKEDAIG